MSRFPALERNRKGIKADSQVTQHPNFRLFQDGRRYLKELPPMEHARYEQAMLRPIAQKQATSVAEMRTAVEFVFAVKAIVDTAGASTKELVLSGENALLTPKLIVELSRFTPQRIRAAMGQAACGLHPFAPPLQVGTPPELAAYEYDVLRLDHAMRLLIEGNSPEVAPSLTSADRNAVHRDVTAIRVDTAAMLIALKHFGPRKSPQRRRIATADLTAIRPADVKRARSLVEAVTHDLPLALFQQSSSRGVLNRLVKTVSDVHSLSARLADCTQPTAGRRTGKSLPIDLPEGPESKPGTYVVVMRSEHPAVVRIGRLGTFWLPSGYLLYVGSALGAGGVRKRTDRHCDANAPKMWKIDHIKAIARPVEIWWTHSTEKVECGWAMTLAEMSDYCCPAPYCGGNDCKSCPAHFYHTSERPSGEAFAAMIRQKSPQHGLIYRQRLDG